MFSHVSVGVTDLPRSLAFYDAVMKQLGHERLFGAEEEGFVAYGPEESFFIICLPLDESKKAGASNGTHVCLQAPGKQAVDDFYETALKLGGKDGGPPGIRKEYADDYYACFVFDPDGHKIEALARAA